MADSFSLSHDEIAVIAPLKDWSIYAVSLPTFSKLTHIERRTNVIGVLASGDLNAAKAFNGTKAVAAMDVIVREPNRKPTEPECNIYHYTFEPGGNGSVNQVGPFRDQTILGHWPKGKTADEVLAEYRALSKGEI